MSSLRFLFFYSSIITIIWYPLCTVAPATNFPSRFPTTLTFAPTIEPSTQPSAQPSLPPSKTPSTQPSNIPTKAMEAPVEIDSTTLEPTKALNALSPSYPSNNNSKRGLDSTVTATILIGLLSFIIFCVIVVTLCLRAYYQRLNRTYKVPHARTSIVEVISESVNLSMNQSMKLSMDASSAKPSSVSYKRVLSASRSAASRAAAQRISVAEHSPLPALDEMSTVHEQHNIEADEILARKLQLEERKHVKSASNISIDSQDARMAIELQLQESVAADDKDLEEARQSIIDPEYEKHLDRLDDELLSSLNSNNNAIVSSADVRYAIKLQLMESGVSFEDIPKHKKTTLYEEDVAEEAIADDGVLTIEGDAADDEPQEENEEEAIAEEVEDVITRKEEEDDDKKKAKDGVCNTELLLKDNEKEMLLAGMISGDFVVLGDDETQEQGKGEETDDVVIGNDIELIDKQENKKDNENEINIDGDKELLAEGNDDESEEIEEEIDEEASQRERQGTFVRHKTAEIEKRKQFDMQHIDNELPEFDAMMDDLPDSLDANDAFGDLPDSLFVKHNHNILENNDDDDIMLHMKHENDINNNNESAPDSSPQRAVKILSDIEADAQFARELQRMLSQEHREEAPSDDINSLDVRMAIKLQLMESGVDQEEVFEFAQKQRLEFNQQDFDNLSHKHDEQLMDVDDSGLVIHDDKVKLDDKHKNGHNENANHNNIANEDSQERDEVEGLYN